MVLCTTLSWDRLQNGALLDAAERTGFDVLVTCDQNIPHQQNFTGRRLSVVVLSTNDWQSLLPFAARIATRIDFAQPGQVTRIDITKL